MRKQTPADLGYTMPAEWEAHEATWISWPKDDITFPGRAVEQVEDIFCDAIHNLQRHEKVRILVNDDAWQDAAETKLEVRKASQGNVEFYHIPSVDVWARDYAPTFLKNKEDYVAAVKWRFNAWGRKYPALYPDNKAGMAIAEETKVPIFNPGIVMEGGAIDTNGRGTLLTTTQCLLNKNRNPTLNKKQIEQKLKDYTGSQKIIWLKDGILGDDTDGHVDDVARFSNSNTVLCAYEDDKKDGNYRALKRNYEILKNATDADGNKLNVVKLPMPDPIITPKRTIGGPRLPASYANFYIGNRSILAPVYGQKKDDLALDILKHQFPGREVIPLYSVAHVYGAGAIHCSTQQQPKALRQSL